jgi:nucleoside-diphosphate-sugar epimerase
MLKITIIGKGFLGKNLLDHYNQYDYQIFDSKNIASLSKQNHDIIFCAAPSGKKWLVNQNKEQDLSNILSLIDILKFTKFKKLILFSTIDVYNHSCIIENENSTNYSHEPYGQNRKILENEITKLSGENHIIRLPALFGKHLEKNYIFDLLNNNMLDKIKTNSSFQWYPTSKLVEHIDFVIDNNIPLLNLSVEPLETQLIVDTFFSDLTNKVDYETKGIFYDMRSQYVKNKYFLNKKDILLEMETYIGNVRNNN